MAAFSLNSQSFSSKGARSFLSKLWWAPEVRSMKTCPTFILCPSLPRLAATLWQLGPRWSFGCKLAPEWVGLQLGVRPSGSGSRWDHLRQPSHWSSKAAGGCSRMEEGGRGIWQTVSSSTNLSADMALTVIITWNEPFDLHFAVVRGSAPFCCRCPLLKEGFCRN